MNTQHYFAKDLETKVARFGRRVTASLSEHNRALPHDVSERLRFSREQALLKAQSARAALAVTAVPSTQVVSTGNTAALGGGSQGWLKLASLLPLLLLVAGLLLIDHSQWFEQITAAAEIDTALLADNLPPAAYGDPGFSEYLSDEQE